MNGIYNHLMLACQFMPKAFMLIRTNVNTLILKISFLLLVVNGNAQTNNYFGTSGAINGAVWSTNVAGPYSSPLDVTGGAVLNFGNATTSVTGASITITGINATANVNSWTGAGTLATGGTIANINVAGGITLNMISQNFSTAAGTGFNKSGNGVLAFSNTLGTYSGGFTLSAGTMIAGGINAMGSGGTLTLNGGILASDGNMNFSGKYPGAGGITIGGDVQFGEIAGLADPGANLTFTDNMSLPLGTHTLTLGNAGTTSFGGIISGTSGVVFTANVNGTGIFDIINSANTLSGTINLNGGRTRFAADGSFGNAVNLISIDGGRLLSNNTFSINHNMLLGIAVGTGIDLAAASTLTISGIIADKTTNGSFTKYGAGTLTLSNANTFTGTTYINASGGTLQLKRPGGGTLPAVNNVVVNGGSLKISSNQTLNDLTLTNGNLTVDNGITLTINGTFEYFEPANITLSGTGKIAYGPTGTLKYSGAANKAITLSEFPILNGPYSVICDNTASITLGGSRTINGSLILNNGIFKIGSGVMLDLDGASLSSAGGLLEGTNTSDLTVQGTTGGTVLLPVGSDISLKNVTIGGTRTLAMDGVNNINLSGAFTIAAGAVYDNGGESQLQNNTGGSISISGKFITRDAQGFTGTNTAVPGIVPVLDVGCIIEFGLANGVAQAVTARSDYSNVTISGTGIKTPGNTFNPFGNLLITGNPIFDCISNNIGDANTNLTMDGGRLIVGTGGTQPAMDGIYNLSGGVVEFASASSKTIRNKTYQHIEVTGTDVGNSSGNITLNNLGTFTVKSGAVFSINDNNITGPVGTQTVIIENGAVFNCGNSKGFNGFVPTLVDNSSLNPDIENIQLNSGSTINYNRNNDQVITNAGGIAYHHLIISGTSGIKTASAGTITIQGNLSKTGASTFVHGNGKILFNSTTLSQNFANTGSTSFNFYDLTCSNTFGNGLNALNDFGIVNQFELTSNSKLNVSNSDITLLSDNLRTAQVTTIPATAAILYSGTGRFNVERFYPSYRAWRLVTSPLSFQGTAGTIFTNWQNNGVYTPGVGALVTGPNPLPANGLDVSIQNNYSLKKFENNAFVNIGNTLVPLSNGTAASADNIGYLMFVRGDRNPINTVIPNTNNTTLSSRGKLQTGQQIFDVTNPSVLTSPCFSLIGNPYASPIDFNLLTKNNVIPYRFYVWDPHIGQVGGYVTMEDIATPGSFYPTAPYGASPQRNAIQSSQAFFVARTAPGPASVVFEEADKTDEYVPTMFRPVTGTGATPFRLVSNLYILQADNSLILADGNLAEFSAGFQNVVDDLDALKFSNINETLAFTRSNKNLSVERRALIGNKDTLFYNLSRQTQRQYQLQLITENMDPLMTAFLEDAYTKIKTKINTNQATTYNFSVDDVAESTAANRFRIVFELANGSPLPVHFSSVHASPKGDNIVVEWNVENEMDTDKYEVEKSNDGVHFNSVSTVSVGGSGNNSNTYKWLDESALEGENFYRIKSTALDGQLNYSRIVSVKMPAKSTGIRVYPNPITNNIIQIQFNNMTAGIYKFRLIDGTGQVVITDQVKHDGGNNVKRITFKTRPVNGNYQLELIEPGITRKILKVVIQ